MTQENKIRKLEEAVILRCCSRNTNSSSQGFFVDILTKRISQLEKQLIKKDTITKYLSNKITSCINKKSHSVDKINTLDESITSINNSKIVRRKSENKRPGKEIQEKNKKKGIHSRSLSQMFFKIGFLENSALFTVNTCVGISF